MIAFPPEDLCSFLQLSVGPWLSLRSLMDPEGMDPIEEQDQTSEDARTRTQSWHASERGELTLTFLAPTRAEDWGGLEITLPDQATQRLTFQRDGTLRVNDLLGLWQLSADGSLLLEVQEGSRVIKERIWFSKPNLRLRCTVAQSLEGQPGQASFSSEIRRILHSQETKTIDAQ